MLCKVQFERRGEELAKLKVLQNEKKKVLIRRQMAADSIITQVKLPTQSRSDQVWKTTSA
jgi:hypothetical protein